MGHLQISYGSCHEELQADLDRYHQAGPRLVSKARATTAPHGG